MLSNVHLILKNTRPHAIVLTLCVFTPSGHGSELCEERGGSWFKSVLMERPNRTLTCDPAERRYTNGDLLYAQSVQSDELYRSSLENSSNTDDQLMIGNSTISQYSTLSTAARETEVKTVEGYTTLK